MDFITADWLNLIVRWFHLTAGIAWIGSSFYFVWLDMSLRKNIENPQGVLGESWMVHGGGFYHVQKYNVAPERMPKELHWFKWEAYTTWLTGFALLAIIYYWGADSFLIDRSVMDLTANQAIDISILSLIAGWVFYHLLCLSPIGRHTGLLFICVFVFAVAAAYGYSHVFSGRAAFIHIGVLLGSIMVGNVFFVIIPNQRIVVADLIAGKSPDPALGKQAKQRSLHNNYLTLPVLFMMISNHYPMTYGHEWNWVIAGAILIIGGTVRHFINQKEAGAQDPLIPFYLPAAALMMGTLMYFAAPKDDPALEGQAISTVDIFPVIEKHCVACHAAEPTDESFIEAPGGVVLDTIADIERYASQINNQAGITNAMPLGNMTNMTEEERSLIRAWARQQ